MLPTPSSCCHAMHLPDPAWSLGYPLAWGRPVARAHLREQPEDFQVDELLDVDLSGEGEHVWLQVRKRDCNTRDVLVSLARFAGVSPSVVGYSGLKDKRAVCTQWFSVPVPIHAGTDFSGWQMGGCELLVQRRHSRKLRPGTHRGNRFRLRLTGLQARPAALGDRLQLLREHGVPNGFGEQRFGHARRNILAVLAAQEGHGRRPDRHVGALWLSAARSFLFNEVLRQRVADGSWLQALPGDVLMLDGSGSLFVAEQPDDTVQARVRAGDLHVSGPLWGEGGAQPRGLAADVEASALKPYHSLMQYITRRRGSMHRRPLRVRVPDLEWSMDGANTLVLAFALPSGSFATAVVREFCTVLEQ